MSIESITKIYPEFTIYKFFISLWNANRFYWPFCFLKGYWLQQKHLVLTSFSLFPPNIFPDHDQLMCCVWICVDSHETNVQAFHMPSSGTCLEMREENFVSFCFDISRRLYFSCRGENFRGPKKRYTIWF